MYIKISDCIRRILRSFDPIPRHERFTKPEQLESLNTAASLFQRTPESRLKEEFRRHYKGDAGDKFFEVAKDLYKEKVTPEKAQNQWDSLKIKYIKEKPKHMQQWSPFLEKSPVPEHRKEEWSPFIRAMLHKQK